jgi:cell division protein FtsI/penicillin-binding protein 2
MPGTVSTATQAAVSRAHRQRLLLAVGAITLLFGVIAWRLFVIQVVDHERHAASARRLRGSVEPVLAYRGDIRTSDHVLLNRTVVDYEVGIDPERIPRDKLQTVVRLVCEAVGLPPEHRRERLRTALERQAAGGRYVHLARAVREPLVQELRAAMERTLEGRELQGFVVEPRARRTYPRGTFASSIVGVTDASGAGVEGIEKTQGPYLSGRDGRREIIKDAPQRTRIFQVGNLDVAPVQGYDVYLTIHSTLQAIVEEELEAGIQRERAAAGVFILMDCHTGDILALASSPTYDPNRYSDYPESERKKRRANRAIESLHEPGSVIKPFYAAHVLETRLLGLEQRMTGLVGPPISWDGGKTATFGRRRVTDVHPHEGMTFQDALVHSSNIGFALIGMRLGKAGITEVLHRFGLDRATGIELPAEAELAPWSGERKWTPIYSATSASFGYEIMVTPIQLCRAFAALINGGYLLRPRIVDRLVRGAEERRFPARVIDGRPISEETSRRMRELLRLVVEEGTAKWQRIEGFEYGGKTGTSDMARGGYAKTDYLASFEAFAPYENPRVVALCMIEKPRAHIYGGMVAGPIVAQVFRRMFHVANETRLAVLEKRNRS